MDAASGLRIALRRRMKISVWALGLSIAMASLTACNDHKAEEAKKEADQKAAEAAKSAKEAEDKAAEAKREADVQATKAHAEAKTALQKDIDAAGRKATYLREKGAKLTGAAKANGDAAITEMTNRETAAKTSLAKLDTATGAAWDSAKLAVESDIAALNKAVDAAETTIKK